MPSNSNEENQDHYQYLLSRHVFLFRVVVFLIQYIHDQDSDTIPQLLEKLDAFVLNAQTNLDPASETYLVHLQEELDNFREIITS